MNGKAKEYRSTQLREKVMQVVFLIAACISILAVALICIYLFANGLPAIAKIGPFEFLLGTDWRPDADHYGIFPMIIGSIYVTAGAIIVGVPLGLLAAIYMAKFCPAPLYKFLKPAVDLLAGIPSIVYGFFGLTVIVPISRELLGGGGLNLLTTSFVLGIMILPTIISISENSLRAVPKPFYEGAVALGATKERAIFRTMFPAASSGVLTAIILGMGRAIGETAAITLICGNIDQIPGSLADPFITLASAIASGMGYASTTNLERPALIAVAAVLLIIILLITTVVMLLKKKKY